MGPETPVLRRAQAWLGTLVEIRALQSCLAEQRVLSIMEEAFREVADIHRLLSRQQGGRDLRTIANARRGASVSVDARTVEVLGLAMELRDRSGGRFDPDRHSLDPTKRSDRSAWQITGPDTLVVTGHGDLDLDGIAKGYAVDRAVRIMEKYGIPCVVNAGGDIRCSAGTDEPIHARSPLLPGRLLDLGTVSDFAIACSHTRPADDAGLPLASRGIHDPRDRRRAIGRRTVCVAAPSCAVADALTKVVAVEPEDAPSILGAYDALAWVIEPVNGRACVRRCGVNAHVRHAA